MRKNEEGAFNRKANERGSDAKGKVQRGRKR